jgi:hypothetical protein
MPAPRRPHGSTRSGGARSRVLERARRTGNTDLAMPNPTTATSSMAPLLRSAAAKLQRVVESRPRHQERTQRLTAGKRAACDNASFALLT